MGSHNITRNTEELNFTGEDYATCDRNQRRQRSNAGAMRKREKTRRSPRTERDQAFRCRKCRQFIGAPISGGRHRNHCPNCLFSLHVDLRQPGDRCSDCESLMAPRGLIVRRNGEQMILHECLGCGKTQPSRVAADDNPVLLMRVEPIGIEVHAEAIAPIEEIA
ncbi:MAG: RNHCP domain-containing protein [Chloroflexia bacterium]|nr:RNHCP domain-containing protein [Chloroflexia bacterium]